MKNKHLRCRFYYANDLLVIRLLVNVRVFKRLSIPYNIGEAEVYKHNYVKYSAELNINSDKCKELLTILNYECKPPLTLIKH